MTAENSAEDRANVFIMYTVRSGIVWALKNEQGWRLLRAGDGREAFPVWSKQEDAQAEAKAEETAQAIPLDEWMQKWLPGLAGDSTWVAMDPRDDDGMLMDSAELLEEFEDEIEESGG